MVVREPAVRPSTDGQAAAAAIRAPGRRRRISLAVVALLVSAGAALTFAVLWSSAGERVPVLAVARPVAAGQVISAGDLVVVRVSVDPGLQPLPGASHGEVVGQRAAVGLVPGTLLVAGHLSARAPVGDEQAIVGLALRGGRLPSTALRPGDRVQVVLTDAPAAGTDGQAVTWGRVLATGTVFGIEALDDATGGLRVSLLVDADVAAEIAGAGAADRVSLVWVADP